MGEQSPENAPIAGCERKNRAMLPMKNRMRLTGFENWGLFSGSLRLDAMNKKTVQFAFVAIFSLAMFVPAVFILKNLPIFVAWILIWGCFFWGALLAPFPKDIRGFLMFTASLLLSTIGLAYCEKVSPSPEDKKLVEIIANVMLLAGGAVGANFISDGLSSREKR
jgi:peptidoglycan/LPS O-acetylase OafA/YrhL